MSYYKTHKGKYVLATPNEIYRLDKVDVDISHDHPAGAPAGIYLKVGIEFEFAGEGFLERIWHQLNLYCRCPSGNEEIQIYGVALNRYLSVLVEFRQKKPEFDVRTIVLYVIGGQCEVKTAYIDIDLCGIQYTRHQVYFADIPYKALIGKDLLMIYIKKISCV